MDSIFSQSGKVVVLGSNPNFADRIEFLMRETGGGNFKMETVDELPELLQRCRTAYGSVGVVQLSGLADGWGDQILAIHRFLLDYPSLCLLAVVPDQQFCAKRLLQAGFRGVFPMASLPLLAAATRRFWATVNWPPQNVTELVISNLPWTPIE